jgi:hypothetical protein
MKHNIKHDGPPPATVESATAPARELAQRLSGTDEILLLWHPATEQVELSVLDQATGAGFHIEVAPTNAIDSFYHPYAYAVSHKNAYRTERAERKIIDG